MKSWISFKITGVWEDRKEGVGWNKTGHKLKITETR